MEIRVMKEQDIPAVRTMFQELYRHLHQLGFYYQLNEAYLDEYLTFQLTSRWSRVLLQEEAGKAVGCIGFSVLTVNRKFISPEAKQYGLISEVFVQEGYRGQGLARELVRAAEKHLKDMGITLILVEALTKNYTAHSLYEGLGFTPYYTSLAKRI